MIINIIRCFFGTILFVDGLVCLFLTIQFARDFKRNSQDYVNCNSRLQCKHIIMMFAFGAILCWALMLLPTLL